MSTKTLFIILCLANAGIRIAHAGPRPEESQVRRTSVERYLGGHLFQVEERNFKGEKTWFKLHRPVQQLKQAFLSSSRPPVILVNATHSNFNTFFVGSHSIVSILLENGYAIYGHSHRNDSLFVPHCQPGPCSEAQEINLERTQGDLLEIARLAERETGQKPLIVGFSMGAIIVSTLIARSPEHFRGAILLDGVAYVESPLFRAAWEKNCSRAERMIRKGTWTTYSEYQWVKWVADRFVVGTTLERFFAAPALLGLALAKPPRTHQEFSNFRANPTGAYPRFTSVNDVATLMLTSSYATSYHLVRDITCTLSRPGESLRDGLERFPGPVLGVFAEYGYGGYMDDQMGRLIHPRSRRVFVPELAHVDLIASRVGQARLAAEIGAWTDEVFGPRSPRNERP